MRKIEPLNDALAGYTAWASGVRRADSLARAKTPIVSWDLRRKIIKIAPIATWTDDDVADYIETNSLMVNPLLEDGYPSIGCEPCTSRADRRRPPRRAVGRTGQDGMRYPPVSVETPTLSTGLHPDTRTATAAAPGGATLWFTGLPSSGKSTIAHALADRLIADGVRVQVLDGDDVRPHLSAGLGFSRTDRDINVTRIGWVARLLAGHGVVVLVPVIAPYAECSRRRSGTTTPPPACRSPRSSWPPRWRSPRAAT